MEQGRPAVSTNVWTSTTVTGNHDICGSKYGCRYQMIAFTSNTFSIVKQSSLASKPFPVVQCSTWLIKDKLT